MLRFRGRKHQRSCKKIIFKRKLNSKKQQKKYFSKRLNPYSSYLKVAQKLPSVVSEKLRYPSLSKGGKNNLLKNPARAAAEAKSSS